MKPFALKKHQALVWTLAFSPDGKTLASGSADNNVVIWDVPTGEDLMTLKHNGTVEALRFSPDGRLLASASHEPSRGSVCLWRAPADEDAPANTLRAQRRTERFRSAGQFRCRPRQCDRRIPIRPGRRMLKRPIRYAHAFRLFADVRRPVQHRAVGPVGRGAACDRSFGAVAERRPGEHWPAGPSGVLRKVPLRVGSGTFASCDAPCCSPSRSDATMVAVGFNPRFAMPPNCPSSRSDVCRSSNKTDPPAGRAGRGILPVWD